MNEHLNDEYVKKAQKEGYRCRAVYKLIEITDKNQIITKGDRILDLGAAPGGWSQVGVDFLQGDFTEMSVYKALLSLTKDQKMNTVLSDMAPNMSGQLSVDQPKSMYLAELALDMAIKTLTPNGHFLVKVFQGDGFDAYVQIARQTFKRVAIKKPKASRARSKEVYLLASQLK